MPATCFFSPPFSLFFADCRVYSVCSRCQTSVDTRSAFQPPTHIRQAGLDYRRQGAIFDSDSSLAWKSGTRSVQTLLPLDTGVLGCRARWGWGRKGVEGLAEESYTDSSIPPPIHEPRMACPSSSTADGSVNTSCTSRSKPANTLISCVCVVIRVRVCACMLDLLSSRVLNQTSEG